MSSHLGESVTSVQALSAELAVHVPDIHANAAAYQEMRWALSAEQLGEVARVKEVLCGLPLVHTTSAGYEEAAVLGILPFESKPEESDGNSSAFDKSLGLTGYVFAHWGSAEKSQYGRNHVLIDPSLLADEATIVTPQDITPILYGYGASFEELSEKAKDNLQGYFDSIVTGKDWQEIMARRVWLEVRRKGFFVLDSLLALGEVKYHGAILPERLVGCLRPQDDHGYWKRLMENGFVPGPVHRADLGVANSYDKTPEQLDTSLEASRRFWQRAL